MAKKKKIKYPSTSINAKLRLKDLGIKEMYIVSPIPVDKVGCKCKPFIQSEIKQARAEKRPIRFITCPRDKTLMKPYEIICSNCKNVVAFVYATDKRMKDWCDLHYICKMDSKNWYGAMTINISPVDNTLGIECACGQDTRDFRANPNMNQQLIERICKKNFRGRNFGYKNSKFSLRELKDPRKYIKSKGIYLKNND